MADCLSCGSNLRFRDRLQGGVCASCREQRAEAAQDLEAELVRVAELGFPDGANRIDDLETRTGLSEEDLSLGRAFAFATWAERNENRTFKYSDLVEATRALEFFAGHGMSDEKVGLSGLAFVVAKFAESGIPVDFSSVELPLWKGEQPVFELPATQLRSDLQIEVVERGSGFSTNESHVLKVADRGTLTFTSERVVFIGSHSSLEIQRDNILNLASNEHDLTVFLRFGTDPVIFRTVAPAPCLQEMVAFMARGDQNQPQTAKEAWGQIKDMGKLIRKLRRQDLT